MKKFWSCLLVICLLLTVIPVQPLLYAEEDPAQTEEQDSSREAPPGKNPFPHRLSLLL